METQQKEAPKNILNVAKFLRSSSDLKNRQGILNGKRVVYFKGKSALKALLKESYGKLKEVPKVTSENEAREVLQEVLAHAFFLRVERSESGSRKKLEITSYQSWAEDQYYAWFYEGSQLMTILGGIGLISVVFAAVLFPLWPSILRDSVWYLSVAILSLFGVFMVIAVVRLILYIMTMIVIPPGIWLFPKLFEDVGFVDSFIPLWAWEVPKKKVKITEDDEVASGSQNVNKDLRTTVEDVEDEEKFEESKDDDDKKVD
ncbi:16739_t:CDS:2 [Funneliformis mosseae]|uniref:Translocation protein SEC62 n=1 Tax=Funneliformis mosseae TaxID=27381 RepID=A0A9N8W8D4_FUNMO|nr:16739_t:CDS:2 [Funneliformis mosseae]